MVKVRFLGLYLLFLSCVGVARAMDPALEQVSLRGCLLPPQVENFLSQNKPTEKYLRQLEVFLRVLEVARACCSVDTQEVAREVLRQNLYVLFRGHKMYVGQLLGEYGLIPLCGSLGLRDDLLDGILVTVDIFKYDSVRAREARKMEEALMQLPTMNHPSFFKLFLSIFDEAEQKKLRSVVSSSKRWNPQLFQAIFPEMLKNITLLVSQRAENLEQEVEENLDLLAYNIRIGWFNQLQKNVTKEGGFLPILKGFCSSVCDTKEKTELFNRLVRLVSLVSKKVVSRVDRTRDTDPSQFVERSGEFAKLRSMPSGGNKHTKLIAQAKNMEIVCEILRKYYNHIILLVQEKRDTIAGALEAKALSHVDKKKTKPKKKKVFTPSPSPDKGKSPISFIHPVSPQVGSTRVPTPDDILHEDEYVPVSKKSEHKKNAVTKETERKIIIEHRYEGVDYRIKLENGVNASCAVQSVTLAPGVLWEGDRIECERRYEGEHEWKRHDYFHQFSHLVDRYLHWGVSEQVQKDDKQVMVSVLGSISYKCDGKACEDSGFFQYTFNAQGECYHRFFKCLVRKENDSVIERFPTRSFVSQQLKSMYI